MRCLEGHVREDHDSSRERGFKGAFRQREHLPRIGGIDSAFSVSGTLANLPVFPGTNLQDVYSSTGVVVSPS